MRFPRIPRRWRLRSLMVLVAVSAVGLFAYREYRERGPVYWEIARMRVGGAPTRANAALGLGLLGPRASFATWVLDGALDDPDANVRAEAAYALIRLGSRSPRLVPILVDQIERTPEPEPGFHPETPLFWLFGVPPAGWTLSDGGLPRNDPLQALMMIRPDAALVVPGLRKPLASAANHVRRAALGALLAVASWTTPPSPELAEELLAVVAADRPSSDRRNLEEPFDERKRAVDALARLDRPAQERAVAMLATDLRELGTPRSYEAVALLPRLDGGTAIAVSALAEHVRDGDDVRRSIALVLLRWIGEPAAPSAPTILRVIEAQDNDRAVHIGLLRMSWWLAVSRWVAAKPIVIGPAVEGRPSVIALGVKAIKAMGNSVERAAIRDLIAFVQDPDQPADRKRGAIAALGDFGPSAADAVPALVALIGARRAAYQLGPAAEGWNGPEALAAEALGRIAADGNPEVVATLAGLLDSRVGGIAMAAARALSALGPKARPAIPALARALGSPVQGLRFEASEALGKIGPEVIAALPALVAALDDEDRSVRTHAVEALGTLGPAAKAAVPKMVRVLWDFGPRLKVAESLGRVGPDAAPALPILLFHHDLADRFDRPEIARVIDRIAPPVEDATIAGPLARLGASEPVRRLFAVYELGRMFDENPPPLGVVAVLAVVLEDREPLVRQMAASVLARVGPSVVAAGPALVRAARDPDEGVRKLATVALGRSAAILPEAVPTLAAMLKDDSPAVRDWAAGGLSRSGPSAVPALIAGLEGKDVPTRVAIVTALGRFVPEHPEAVATLVKAVDDPAEPIRVAAVDVLGEHVNTTRRDAVLPALVKATNDPSRPVVYWACQGLATARPAADVLPTLIDRLERGEADVRAAAAGAFWRIGEATNRDRDPEVVKRAVTALTAALRDREAEVRSAAASSLGQFRLDAASAEPALRAAMNDPDRYVRDKAAEAIQQIAAAREWASNRQNTGAGDKPGARR